MGGAATWILLEGSFAPAASAPTGGKAEPLPAAAGGADGKARGLIVGNTDGLGVYIRRSRVMEDTIRAWPDGTAMTVVGDEQEGEGRRWWNVKDPAGNVGWVPSEYLVATAIEPLPAKWLPGLVLADIAEILAERGLRLGDPIQGKTGFSWVGKLSRDDGSVEYSVVILGDGPSEIRQVTAAVFQFSQPNDRIAAGFLGQLAMARYEGADPARARDWVESTIPRINQGTEARLTIGGTNFRLLGAPTARILHLVPYSGDAR